MTLYVLVSMKGELRVIAPRKRGKVVNISSMAGRKVIGLEKQVHWVPFEWYVLHKTIGRQSTRLPDAE